MTFFTNVDQLRLTKRFMHVGSNVTSKCDLTAEIERRVHLAPAAFRRLTKRVFTNHNLSTRNKMAAYNTICVSILLYALPSPYQNTWALHISGCKLSFTCIDRTKFLIRRWAAEQGQIQPVTLGGGTISVIFRSQVYNSFTTVRETKYTSQHCCDKTMDDNKMDLCRQCSFVNCTKSWWIKLLSQVLGMGVAIVTP